MRGYLEQRGELARETTRLEELEQTRDRFTRDLRALGQERVLERRARELGLVRPDERAFIVRGLDEIEAAAAAERQPDSGDGGGIFGWLTDLI